MQAKLSFVSLSLFLSAEILDFSDLIYHEKSADWQEEWGETDKTMTEEFQTLLNFWTFEKPVDFCH